MGKVKQPPKPDERMTLAEWRFEELMALGLAADEALNLIEIPDIVHSARKLLASGCPPALVVSLLEE